MDALIMRFCIDCIFEFSVYVWGLRSLQIPWFTFVFCKLSMLDGLWMFLTNFVCVLSAVPPRTALLINEAKSSCFVGGATDLVFWNLSVSDLKMELSSIFCFFAEGLKYLICFTLLFIIKIVLRRTSISLIRIKIFIVLIAFIIITLRVIIFIYGIQLSGQLINSRILLFSSSIFLFVIIVQFFEIRKNLPCLTASWSLHQVLMVYSLFLPAPFQFLRSTLQRKSACHYSTARYPLTLVWGLHFEG